MSKEDLFSSTKKRKKTIFLSIWLTVNLIIILLLIQTFPSFRFSRSDFEFTSLQPRCEFVFICDLDKDGKDDISVTYINEPLPYKKNLQIFSPLAPTGVYSFSFFWDTLIDASEILMQPQDIDEDGEIDIPIVAPNKRDLILKVHNPIGKIKNVINLRQAIDEGQLAGQITFSDLDGNGQKEIITAIMSTFSGAPRAIKVWDMEKEKLLWAFLMGCAPDIFEVIDINNDGKKEIVVMGRAPHNGVAANGTDDDHSYIFTLDNQGNLIWRLTLGGFYTRWWIKIFDIDKDGKLEIVASKGCDREIDPEPGEIRIIEASTGETEFLHKESPSFSEIFLLPKLSGETQIAVANSVGDLVLFNRLLHEIKRVRIDHPAIVRGVAKLGHNPEKNYLFVQAGFTKFLIFDEELKELFRYNLDYFSDMHLLSFHTFKNQGRGYGLVNASRLYLLEKKTWPFLKWLARLVTSKFASHLLFLIILNGLLTYLFALKISPSNIELRVQSEWLEQAQDLAHKMKNSLFTIQLQAENLKLMAQKEIDDASRSLIQPIAQSILDDVSELNRQTRILMKILAPQPLILKKTEINGLIKRAVAKYVDFYRGKIDFTLDLDAESTIFAVDETQLEEALSNLISNAIEAMPDGGRLTIRTTVIHSPRKQGIKGLEIEVEDNGQGIPEELLSEIFKPSFTTKKGGLGIGLTITKRIIEAHGGRISVFSRPGVGTKFAIYLPWKN
ncbi:MAG: ATP-binding protein [Candidatus Aminicenantes bacterium]|nr:ATP-binding protein [Candidatus Aminicenantes bacterium]